MADGQVVVEINADGSKAKSAVKDVTRSIETEGKKWDQAAGQSTSKIETAFSNMAGKIVASLTAAGIGAAILKWGTDALNVASDLAEVQNVVDTVFGESSSTIEAWSQKAGKQFGLTELQAKKFTSTLGAMMKSSGLAGSQIVDMSTDLAGPLVNFSLLCQKSSNFSQMFTWGHWMSSWRKIAQYCGGLCITCTSWSF